MKSFLLQTILMFLITGTAFSQVVYTDINPDVTSTISNNPQDEATDIVKIDFDGDGTGEYNFGWNVTGNLDWYMFMTSGPVNELNLKGTFQNQAGARYIEPMPYFSVIGPNSNWGTSFPNPLIGDIDDPNFQNFGESCVGCKFVLNGNTHYGWVRVSFDNNKTLTVEDYAYESSPNIEIIACDIVSVNDIIFDTYFNIYPIPTSTRLTIETKNEVKIKSVRIINLAGQITYSTNETFLNTINIPESLQGLYFLQIETTKNKVLIKKIIIE